MSGTNYLLDTNAIIALLNGNRVIEKAISRANWLGISVINIVEFLSFGNLTQKDKKLFELFLQRVSIINLNYPNDMVIIDRASVLRIAYKLKLPDAIIAASTILNQAVLITNDKQLSGILNLQILPF